MRTLYSILHVPFEHPGMITDWAKSRGIEVITVPLYEDETMPTLDENDFLLIMGGPMGVYDEPKYSWMSQEKALIADAVERGIPTLGICLGAQLIASVLKADVVANAHTEIGFSPVALTQNAAQNPIFADIPHTFTPFHWHSDTFFIPKGAMRIAGNDACMNQGFIGPGKVLGFQFHLEVKETLVKEWYTKLPPMAEPPYVQDRQQVASAVSTHVPQNRTILETILDRFYLTKI